MVKVEMAQGLFTASLVAGNVSDVAAMRRYVTFASVIGAVLASSPLVTITVSANLSFGSFLCCISAGCAACTRATVVLDLKIDSHLGPTAKRVLIADLNAAVWCDDLHRWQRIARTDAYARPTSDELECGEADDIYSLAIVFVYMMVLCWFFLISGGF